MVLALFVLNINVVYYTSHTIALIGLARSLQNLSFTLDPSLCDYSGYVIDVVSIDGRCILAAPPGLPLILSQVYRVSSMAGIQDPLLVGGVVVAIFGSLAVFVSWLLSMIITGDRRASIFSAMAIALSGPLWVYSTHIFPQAVLGFTYGVLVYLAMRASLGGLGVLGHVAAGFTASLSALLDPAMVPAIVAIAIVILVRYLKDPERLRAPIYTGLFLAGASPLAIFLLIYNTSTTGNPLVFPEQLWLERLGIRNHGFVTPLPLGIYMLIADPRKGLITLYPVFIMALVYIARMLSTIPSSYVRAVYAVSIVSPLIVHSAWYDVDGGLSFGPRFIVPLTTLLAPPIAYAYKHSRVARIAVIPLIIYGIAVNSITVTTTPYPSSLEDLKPWQNQFINSVFPHLLSDVRSSYLYSLLRALGEPLSTWVALLINTGLPIAVIGTFIKITKDTKNRSRDQASREGRLHLDSFQLLL